MLAPFIDAIIAALTWLGTKAFTGATGVALGSAVGIGISNLLARIGIGLVSFGVIYTLTSTLLGYVTAGIDPNLANLLAYTGLATGINLVLSSMMGVLSIRVLKVGFLAWKG